VRHVSLKRKLAHVVSFLSPINGIFVKNAEDHRGR
jgi:hypothetical protein